MKKALLYLCIFILIPISSSIFSKGTGAFTRVDFMLTLPDGVKLDCTKYIPNGSPPANGWPVIIVTHGYGLSKYSEMEEAEEHAAEGYYSLVYSMRGQGISEGQSNFISTIEANDLKEVVLYVKNDANTNDNRIGIHGGSQGGITPFLAVCTGLQVRTIIPDMASPEAGSNWIENGGIKMTLIWTCSYPTTLVRYNPLVSRFKPWALSSQPDKWDSLAYYLPINRDFIGQVGNCQIPIMVQNCWQDRFFNTLGAIRSAYILPYNNEKMYFGATDGHGSDHVQGEEDYKEAVFSDWTDLHLKGIQNNVMNVNEKFTYALSKFPMTDSIWSWERHQSPVWPPAGVQNVKLYFHPFNTLLPVSYGGTQASVSFNNDILDPNVTMEYLVNTEFRGALFDAKFRKNEIVFETPALLQDAILAGTPYAYLYYSSTANGVCQYNMQIWDVRPSGEEKLVTRINWTDRYYTANQVKEKNVNGQAYGHKFLQGNKIRVKVTNLDNVPLYRGQYLADPFLRTNPFMLPVLKQATNKIYINASSRSYIELPLINFVIGIQQISTEVPGGFSLQQNYPNPFNPATKIRFNVPSSGKNNYVKIAVFDITGRELITLVDDNLKPGTYEADWNGTGYSSGVYFCKMTAGDFTSVKKMMLVK